jgi:hypothetical protein
MSLVLPGPVAAYFGAEKAADADALARCFVEEGVVRDEGGTFKGRTAIKQWNTCHRRHACAHVSRSPGISRYSPRTRAISESSAGVSPLVGKNPLYVGTARELIGRAPAAEMTLPPLGFGPQRAQRLYARPR